MNIINMAEYYILVTDDLYSLEYYSFSDPIRLSRDPVINLYNRLNKDKVDNYISKCILSTKYIAYKIVNNTFTIYKMTANGFMLGSFNDWVKYNNLNKG